MLHEKNKYLTLKNFILFATVWVFFSLNSRYLRIPNADIVRWVLLGLLIVVAYFTGDSLELRPPIIVLFFFVAVAPSLLYSINQKESFIKFLSFIVVVWGSYIFFNSLESKEDMEIALKIMMIVMIAFEFQSIFVVFSGGAGGDYTGYNGGRMEGNTSNPNTLGVYSNLSFLASYYWFSNSEGPKKAFFFAVMGISVYTAVMSVSRTAFVTICLNILFIIFIQFRKSGFSYLLLLPILFVFVLAFTGNLQFLGIEALNRLNEEGTGRDELWEKGINVWRQYPVFGCGYDVSRYLNTWDEYQFAFHNSYISILSEIGLWGVLILGLRFLKELLDSSSLFRTELRNNKISLFVLCSSLRSEVRKLVLFGCYLSGLLFSERNS